MTTLKDQELAQVREEFAEWRRARRVYGASLPSLELL